MQLTDPATGRSYIEKRLVRHNKPGQPRKDWKWLSAGWYDGMRTVRLEMDTQVLAELDRE